MLDELPDLAIIELLRHVDQHALGFSLPLTCTKLNSFAQNPNRWTRLEITGMDQLRLFQAKENLDLYHKVGAVVLKFPWLRSIANG